MSVSIQGRFEETLSQNSGNSRKSRTVREDTAHGTLTAALSQRERAGVRPQKKKRAKILTFAAIPRQFLKPAPPSDGGVDLCGRGTVVLDVGAGVSNPPFSEQG